MPVIDQHRTWVKVEQRLETETDPVLRRNLEMLLQHMKAEATLDMDSLMATVSEQALYQNFTPGVKDITVRLTEQHGAAVVRDLVDALAGELADANSAVASINAADGDEGDGHNGLDTAGT